ncbi:MAG: Serine/threonine protein kinase PrkC, regulator of stationary phase [Myxococcaceae bacterium]|nr:Serine/threonine protein kinase PrkC, regulator of stationary phase [Myxococcaceae bacterium]
MWTEGQKIGGYEVLAKLREGGMATLFLAQKVGPAGFSRHVALKVIHPSLANDEQFRQMFLDEATLASRIEHPNVVRVEELGEHNGAHFLTMEFVHGCSLAQLQRVLLAKKRRLAPAYATRIVMHVAEGLHAAHELCDESGRLLNVVHRDVTPENILLAYAGHVKLIDFGIAKAYGRRHRTQDGLLKGKFRYMAPEQALSKTIDRRVDIYQLGIVLWEMLTLRRLFAAEREIDLLASVQRPKVEPPSSLVDRIPAELDDVVMAALDPDPRRRPSDALSFARALARAVPSAHEVDATALCALLDAAMLEHRQRESSSYPAGVYERLGQRTPRATQQLVGAASAAQAATARRVQATYELTEQFGSDSSEAVTRAGDVARQTARKSARALRGRRPLELVRFASELRTSLTRIVEAGFIGSRTYWILIGGVLGLAAALLLITLALHPSGRAVPALPDLLHPSLRVPALPIVQPAR